MRSNLAAVDERWEIRRSAQVRSVWVWRGFLLMSLVAAGIALILAGNGADTFAILWGVIAAGWFVIAMGLWRMHTKISDSDEG
jgi:hypothetical protein